MTRTMIRDAIIFSALFTLFSAIVASLFRPSAKVVNEDTQRESNLHTGKKGCFVTSNDRGMEVAKTFFYAIYTAINVMQTIQAVKDYKARKNSEGE